MYNLALEQDLQKTVMNHGNKSGLIKLIASRLARISPYLELTHSYYSMAQDNCLMCDIALTEFKSKPLAFASLFYNCGDAYVGNNSVLIRQLMITEMGYDPTQKIADAATRQLHEFLDVKAVSGKNTKDDIKTIRKIAIATVMRDFDLVMLPKPNILDPFKRTIKSWPWPKAEEEFCKRYERLADAF